MKFIIDLNKLSNETKIALAKDEQTSPELLVALAMMLQKKFVQMLQ